ncbi:MAG: AMP-binding protein, partial [Thermoanaerobaculia bacterium]
RKVVKGRIDFKSVVACFSGAAPLMAETKKRFEAVTGSRIVEGYSLTEATMACCGNPYGGVNKTGSVGLPMPDVLIRIIDAETNTDRPRGQVGEILMHAPQLMRGYWRNDEETHLVLQPGDDGRMWLHTGDLGYLDEDGYVFIVDRSKDVVKAGGFQVWPREVEEVLASHPSVAEAGVAGLPDEMRGEIVGAWVVLRPGAESVTPDALRRFCKEKLAPYKVPSRIEFRGELPKTMVGKVLRRKLVEETLAK